MPVAISLLHRSITAVPCLAFTKDRKTTTINTLMRKCCRHCLLWHYKDQIPGLHTVHIDTVYTQALLPAAAAKCGVAMHFIRIVIKLCDQLSVMQICDILLVAAGFMTGPLHWTFYSISRTNRSCWKIFINVTVANRHCAALSQILSCVTSHDSEMWMWQNRCEWPCNE